MERLRRGEECHMAGGEPCVLATLPLSPVALGLSAAGLNKVLRTPGETTSWNGEATSWRCGQCSLCL